MRLKDKVAIITGGSRGIGYATADAFLREGATVILAASSQESADKAVESLKEKYPDRTVAGISPDLSSLESLYYIGVLIHHNPDAAQNELHVQQWMPYEDKNELTPVEALQQILDYLHRHEMEALHSSTQIIIAPGYQYKIVRKMVTNFHQPQSTLLLLVSAFVRGNWRKIYDYALEHDFRFLSYGDSSLLIP